MDLTDEELTVLKAILSELAEVNRKLDLVLKAANHVDTATDNIKQGVSSIAEKVVFG